MGEEADLCRTLTPVITYIVIILQMIVYFFLYEITYI